MIGALQTDETILDKSGFDFGQCYCRSLVKDAYYVSLVLRAGAPPPIPSHNVTSRAQFRALNINTTRSPA